MIKIRLECNPFLDGVNTKCLIDDIDVVGTSEFKKCWGDATSYLQDWAGQFFDALVKFKNYDEKLEYEVEFYGLVSDFDDLELAKEEFIKRNSNFKIKLKAMNQNVQLPRDRVNELRDLFEYMQKESPYKELKSEDVKVIFENVLAQEEEIGIVATMSSGKSTLLNAILGQELLPAEDRATTARIAKIYNDDSKSKFAVTALTSDGSLVVDEYETYDNITATSENIKRLNNNDSVHELKITGNIPYINNYGINVVFVDTPGPNNSSDQSHERRVYELLNKSYKPLIIYVLNATAPEINDDSVLLKNISDKMKESGFQSKDRFLFVLNKLDIAKAPTKDDIKLSIVKAKEYLSKHGICNPKIFPISALASKIARKKQEGLELDRIEKASFNSIKELMPFYELNSLAPLSQRGKLKQQELIKTYETQDNKLGLIDIYSGVPALEIAINEYLEKYATRIKIKKAIESFKGFIEKEQIKAKAQELLCGNEENAKKIVQSLDVINKDIENGKKGKDMRKKIQKYNFAKSIESFLKNEAENFSKALGVLRTKESEMDMDKAKKYIKEVKQYLKHIHLNFEAKIKDELNNGFYKDTKKLFDEYRNYVKDLMKVEFMSIDKKTDIVLGSTINTELDEEKILNEFKKIISEKYIAGYKGNPDKAWYKPWTWLDDDFEVVYEYGNRAMFNVDSFYKNYLQKAQVEFDKQQKIIQSNIKKDVDEFKEYFFKKIKELESIIKNKVKEQQELFRNKSNLKKEIEQGQKNIQWLDDFVAKLDKILTI
ncbi:dynamin family protein [Campylobacter sputorum]|uniref:dynamin family protein n=1 Tax=Campylobacter sputorum TaxID=206 RepID=UPI000B771E2B|nr:dynamin family protein [Campylobacter sputorum]ASM37013.1 dynamin domain protein [Campylobacter sputorum bv. faecalis CCUG 20703]